MPLFNRLRRRPPYLRGALRTLRLTRPIGRNPDPPVPGSGRRGGGALRRQAGPGLGPRNPELPRACRALMPLCPLGARAGIGEGRSRRLADGEPARISGDLARHHPRRRYGRAPQHQPHRAGARPLHRRRRPAPRHRRKANLAGSDRCIARALSEIEADRSGFTAQRCATGLRTLPRIDLAIEQLDGRPLSADERPALTDRGQGAVHLHVRHHRHAEGRQHQSFPADAGEPRLRRRDGHDGRRPHV